MSAASASSVASNYRILLPPGWFHIPASADPDAAIRAMSDATFGPSPDDRSRALRSEAERRMRQFVIEAARRGIADVYVPAGNIIRAPIACSIAVSSVAIPRPEGASTDDVLRRLAIDGDDVVVEDIDGQVGVKSTAFRERALELEGDVARRTRETTWVVNVPGSPDRWLVFVSSISRTDGAADPDDLVGAVQELADAIMTTVRWHYEGAPA